MNNRVLKTSGVLQEQGVGALLVMQPENRYYLSGFSGSSGALLVMPEKSFLITDFRYIEQAQAESPHLEIIKMRNSYEEAVAEILGHKACGPLAFEADYINYEFYEKLKERLPGVQLRPVQGLVEKQRLIKEDVELKAIARSMSLLDQGFEYILGQIRPGVAENEIAFELEIFLRKKGASGIAFPFIVASGPRSSLPHGIASERVVGRGDMITLDLGVVVDHYNSDMTRTVALGRPSDEMNKIYDIVLQAQLAGLEAVREGVRASQADAASRKVIEDHGYGEYFGHGTGHGVGLAVHEGPRLSRRDDTVLQEGMVVTVEPGIYLPGRGGVRIEDSVVVERGGCRLLTKSPKDKMIIL